MALILIYKEYYVIMNYHFHIHYINNAYKVYVILIRFYLGVSKISVLFDCSVINVQNHQQRAKCLLILRSSRVQDKLRTVLKGFWRCSC